MLYLNRINNKYDISFEKLSIESSFNSLSHTSIFSAHIQDIFKDLYPNICTFIKNNKSNDSFFFSKKLSRYKVDTVNEIFRNAIKIDKLLLSYKPKSKTKDDIIDEFVKYINTLSIRCNVLKTEYLTIDEAGYLNSQNIIQMIHLYKDLTITPEEFTDYCYELEKKNHLGSYAHYEMRARILESVSSVVGQGYVDVFDYAYDISNDISDIIEHARKDFLNYMKSKKAQGNLTRDPEYATTK